MATWQASGFEQERVMHCLGSCPPGQTIPSQFPKIRMKAPETGPQASGEHTCTHSTCMLSQLIDSCQLGTDILLTGHGSLGQVLRITTWLLA